MVWWMTSCVMVTLTAYVIAINFQLLWFICSIYITGAPHGSRNVQVLVRIYGIPLECSLQSSINQTWMGKKPQMPIFVLLVIRLQQYCGFVATDNFSRINAHNKLSSIFRHTCNIEWHFKCNTFYDNTSDKKCV